MSAAAVIALSLVMAPAPSLPKQGGSVTALVREACIDTGLQRAAFEDLARARGWRSLRVTRRSGAPTGWHLAFRTDGMLITLSSASAPIVNDEPERGATCSVAVDRAAESLPGEVEALAANLGLGNEAPVEEPLGAGRMRAWSRYGDMTLVYGTGAPGDRRAVISVSRQFITVSQ